MFTRYAILALIAAVQFAVPTTAWARTNLSRQEIRQMPILERPSRVGHFYGNTVRRGHYRGAGQPAG